MSTRTRIVAGNWKMHTTPDEGIALAKSLASAWKGSESTEMIIAPPFTHLTAIREVVRGSKVSIAAQNCHWEREGAFTGEISAVTLKEMSIPTVIIGHSERREIFHESDEIVKKKVDVALSLGIRVILCCGESLSTREAGAAKDFVERQLKQAMLHLSADQLQSVVIAYEPIWAIGTGVTASADQAQEMHGYIRRLITDAYSSKVAAKMTILYGGSVKDSNAEALFEQEDVDGGLVGGASLKVDQFLNIGELLISSKR